MQPKNAIRVLLVEDNPTDVLLAREALSRFPQVQLTNVPRLAEAIAFCADKSADVILLDLGLPDSQGLETLTGMLKHCPECPIIVFTGREDEELGLQSLHLGAQDFLAKSQIVSIDLGRAIRYAIERKKIETEKVEAERQLKTLATAVSNAANGIVITDRQGTILYVNAAFSRMTGYSQDEVLGKNPRILKSGRQDPSVYEDLWRTVLQGEVWRGVLCNRRKDGSFYYEEMTVTPVRDENGAIQQFLAVKTDISKQKQAEDLLRSVVDNALDGIICIDENGLLQSFNLTAASQFGYLPSKVLGQHARLLVPASERGEFDSLLAKLRTTEATRAVGINTAVTFQRHDGTMFPAELSISEFLLNNQRHFTGIVRDITERKKLEQALHQSQKMEAFGQLAGGIAHDFNNLLTIISGYSDLLLDLAPANDPKKQHLKAIHDASERAVGLTQQLLAFSRKSILEPRVLDLNDVVRDTAKMLRRIIGEDVMLATLLDPQILLIKIDPSQLGQVLMNLAVNARDAMPRGGKFTIETAQVEVDENYARLHPDIKPGRYVSLQVSDNGCGIAPEIKGRIFEPFFTTKDVGKGTGLGLATVFGIVKQSEGSISVYSEVGVGTTFKILLPAAPALAAAEAPTAKSEKAKQGTETILLVEDEENIRTFAKLILEMYGYTVLTAGNGKEALALCETCKPDVRLVLTDVVMPEMGGREVADRLRQKWPGVKVLFVSGFTDDAMVRHGIIQATDAFLQKPFAPAALLRKVREVLDAPA